MPLVLGRFQGSTLALPSKGTAPVDRLDGGHLVVNPPRPVWERSELTQNELIAWRRLTIAAGQAMLQILQRLNSGCINDWGAGNWALNFDAAPVGLKRSTEHRIVHLHLLGRSTIAKSESWVWGETPNFPLFKDRMDWTANHQRLTPNETNSIVALLTQMLESKFSIPSPEIQTGTTCPKCGYNSIPEPVHEQALCGECS